MEKSIVLLSRKYKSIKIKLEDWLKIIGESANKEMIYPTDNKGMVLLGQVKWKSN